MRTPRWLTPLLIATAICLYFFVAAGAGLRAYFHEDDLMNLYRGIDEAPGIRLLTENLTPFTSANRPMGAVYYRAVFAVAGFDPYPFRMVTYGFLLLNTLLVYLLGKRLSGNREIGVIAALIYCYHHRFIDLYLNNGTIYDILCVTFYLLALLAYIRWRNVFVTTALFIAAMNSKEMAATLPIVLFFYELIYRPPQRTVKAAVRWLFVNNLTAWVLGIMTIFAARAKTANASAFYGNEAYKLVFSWERFISSAGHWLDEMCFTRDVTFLPWMVLLIWAAMLFLAIRSRRKYLLFAFVFLFVAPLPVSFIIQRGFFVMYLPWVGWSLYFATLLVDGRDWLYRRVWHRPPIPAGAWQPERMALFVGLMAVLACANALDPYYSLENAVAEKKPMNVAYDGVWRLHHTLPRGSRVLVLNDPFPPDSYMMLFLVRVNYGMDIEITRGRKDAGQKSVDPRDYNFVWDYRDGVMIETKAGEVEKKT